MLTLGAFATDMRIRAQSAWTGDASDRYEPARLASGRLVAMLDSTASDPGLVADALIDGRGIDVLLCPPGDRFGTVDSRREQLWKYSAMRFVCRVVVIGTDRLVLTSVADSEVVAPRSSSLWPLGLSR